MRRGIGREEHREELRMKIAAIEAEYERRVFGPDPFPDEEMRAMRSQANKLRKAYSSLAFHAPKQED